MDSPADHAKRRTREAVAAMTPAERIELAFALGEDDLRLFMDVQRVERDRALTALRRQRHVGRRPSVAGELDGLP
jgi:hypothetical protein